jgi:TetR/AcrR family transcriptional regulator, regulator of autoinduction and epiphytic fitness
VSYKSSTDPRIAHSRRLICRAALQEFAQEGYAGFRMESVATRAGVGRSTVYRHWPDKAALIADALETLNTQPNPERELVDGTARQRVALLLTHLASALSDSPVSACIPALIHACETDPAVRDFFHAYSAQRRARLTETIAAGVAAGEFASRVDADAASTALYGALFYRRLMTAQGSGGSDGPEGSDAEVISRLVDTVLG